MNNEQATQYIEKEKEQYGKVFSNITFGMDDIMPFKDGTDIEERYFVKNVKLLENYIKMLEDGERKLKKKKKVLFFDVGALSSEEIQTVVNGIELYNGKYKTNLEKLRKCSTCKCLKCLQDCKFASCLACSDIGKVVDCDKKTYNFILFTNLQTKLYNSETNNYDVVKVLGQVSFVGDELDYRIINANGEYLILSYINNMGKEQYLDVKDKDKFNKIANIYERNVAE